MKVTGFNHLTVKVKDLEGSIAFYTSVLGLALVHKGRNDAYLEWGSAWICLLGHPEGSAGVSEGNAGVDHIAFSIAEEDFAEAVEVLQHHVVPIVRGLIQRGQGWSVNFLDPDGVQLELHTTNLHERMTVWP